MAAVSPYVWPSSSMETFINLSIATKAKTLQRVQVVWRVSCFRETAAVVPGATYTFFPGMSSYFECPFEAATSLGEDRLFGNDPRVRTLTTV